MFKSTRRLIEILLPLFILAAGTHLDGFLGAASRLLLPVYGMGIIVLLTVKLADTIWQDRYWLMDLFRGHRVDVNQSRVRALFDSYAGKFDRELRDDLNYRGPELAGVMLDAHLAGQTGLAVADLGCGTGLAAKIVRARAKWLSGVDLSAKMLARAEKLDRYDELHRDSMLDFLQNRPEQFDLLLALDAIIYLEDPWRFFRLAFTGCREGGWLLITTELAPGREADRYRGRRREPRDVTVSVAVAAGFELCDERFDVLRSEAGAPVDAGIYLFRKPPGPQHT